jgi:hypothetical protein
VDLLHQLLHGRLILILLREAEVFGDPMDPGGELVMAEGLERLEVKNQSLHLFILGLILQLTLQILHLDLVRDPLLNLLPGSHRARPYPLPALLPYVLHPRAHLPPLRRLLHYRGMLQQHLCVPLDRLSQVL